jgi:hypothetical protein
MEKKLSIMVAIHIHFQLRESLKQTHLYDVTLDNLTLQQSSMTLDSI